MALPLVAPWRRGHGTKKVLLTSPYLGRKWQARPVRPSYVGAELDAEASAVVAGVVSMVLILAVVLNDKEVGAVDLFRADSPHPWGRPRTQAILQSLEYTWNHKEFAHETLIWIVLVCIGPTLKHFFGQVTVT